MYRILLCFLLSSFMAAKAQQPNWGFGQPIDVSGSGSITCSVFDPIISQTKTTSQSGVANFINSEGVVAWVSSAGTVGGIIYDVNLHQFKTTTFSSNSGNTIANSDGVISFVSSAGTVGGAVYDVCLQEWKYTTFSSNSGNSVINKHGVIAYVSSAGTVGGAIYDPGLQQWKYTTFSNNSGNTIANSQGIISYVSSAGTVGGATYDIISNQWEYTTFSSNNGNTMVNKDGVIAFKSSAGTVGGAAFNFNSGSWSYTTFSSSASNTNLGISNGTITWSNNSGSQKAGFTGSSWSTGSNTNVQCRFIPEVNTGCDANGTAFFWCMSIGANSYSYSAGDGHNISRRWAWKQYSNGGSFSPQLNVSNNSTNSSCSNSVDFPSGIGTINPDNFVLSPNPAADFISLSTGNYTVQTVDIINVIGEAIQRKTVSDYSNNVTFNVSGLDAGIYFLKITTTDNKYAVKRWVKN